MAATTEKLPVLSTIGRFLKYLFVPSYLGQPVHIKHATVVSKERETAGASGRVLLVKIDWHEDVQTIYPSNHRRRMAQLLVSERLWEKTYPGMSLVISCQYSRHDSLWAKARIAT